MTLCNSFSKCFVFIGNSASVDHLIEHELPLSTLNSPVSDAMNVVTLDHRTMRMMSSSSDEQLHNDDDLHRSSDNGIDGDDVEDEDELNVGANIKQHLANRNNLSGSYSNLFRAEKTDDESGKVNQRQTQVETDLSGGMLRENVYSNVPFGSGTEVASSALMRTVNGNQVPASDPSLHVYSNVVSTVHETNLHDISFGGVSSILADNTTLPNVAESLRRFSAEGQSSSTLMADDLDLDDAVLGAGAFGQSNHKSINDTKQFKSNSITVQTPYYSKKMSVPSIDQTNVIPQVSDLVQTFNITILNPFSTTPR